MAKSEPELTDHVVQGNSISGDKFTVKPDNDRYIGMTDAPVSFDQPDYVQPLPPAAPDRSDPNNEPRIRMDRGRTVVDSTPPDNGQGGLHPDRGDAAPSWLCAECRQQWLAAKTQHTCPTFGECWCEYPPRLETLQAELFTLRAALVSHQQENERLKQEHAQLKQNYAELQAAMQDYSNLIDEMIEK